MPKLSHRGVSPWTHREAARSAELGRALGTPGETVERSPGISWSGSASHLLRAARSSRRSVATTARRWPSGSRPRSSVQATSRGSNDAEGSARASIRRSATCRSWAGRRAERRNGSSTTCECAAVVIGRSGGSDRSSCAFAPPAPNESTRASRRPERGLLHGSRSVTTRRLEAGSCRNGSRASSAGTRVPCCIWRMTLVAWATPEAASR